MTTQDWSDYHAWRVSADTMHAAQLVLSDSAYAALSYSPLPDGVDFIVPREAIEDAALAMSPAVAVQFLAAVYQLDYATGEKVLQAIHTVRLKGG